METGIAKWWSYLLLGILAIIFGIIVLVWPTATTYVLIILFGVYALVEGLFAIGYSIARASKGGKFFGMLMLGLVGVLVGAIVLARPGVSTLALVWVIAFWAVLKGIMMIISAFEMTGGAAARWLIGLTGLFAIIVGIIFFVHPIAGVATIILVIGIYALVAGLFMIVASFPMRKAQKSGTGTGTLAAA